MLEDALSGWRALWKSEDAAKLDVSKSGLRNVFQHLFRSFGVAKNHLQRFWFLFSVSASPKLFSELLRLTIAMGSLFEEALARRRPDGRIPLAADGSFKKFQKRFRNASAKLQPSIGFNRTARNCSDFEVLAMRPAFRPFKR